MVEGDIGREIESNLEQLTIDTRSKSIFHYLTGSNIILHTNSTSETVICNINCKFSKFNIVINSEFASSVYS